jgi:hypothetical protein
MLMKIMAMAMAMAIICTHMFVLLDLGNFERRGIVERMGTLEILGANLDSNQRITPTITTPTTI